MTFDPTITGADSKVTIRATRHVALHEAYGRHPMLTARVVVGELKPDQFLAAVGAAVEWKPPLPSGERTLFKGVLTDIQYDGGEFTLTAHGASVRRDLVRTTRGYGVGAAAQPASQLSHMDDLLKGVEGKAALATPAYHLLQHDQTDWQFLLDVAGLCRLLVLCTPEAIRIVDGKPSATHALSADRVVEGSESIAVGLATSAAAATTWDPVQGVVAEKAEVAPKLSPASKLVQSLLDRGNALLGDATHRLFPACYGPALSGAAWAARAARDAAGCPLSWRAQLLDPLPTVGEAVKLPEGGVIDAPLVITQRQLSFSPQAGTIQVFNDVEAAPEGFVVSTAVPRTSSPLLVTGQVASIHDPDRLGRVKVNFPWQKREGADPGGWEAVWCLAPQPFGGIDKDGKPHGALNLPAPFDWVAVLIDPLGGGPPVVLGAVYRGTKSRAPAGVEAPADRLVLLTGGGVRIQAHDGADGQPSTLTLAVAGAKEGEGCTITLSGDGKLAVRAKSADMAASDGVQVKAEKGPLSVEAKTASLKAEATVEGKLDVK